MERMKVFDVVRLKDGKEGVIVHLDYGDYLYVEVGPQEILYYNVEDVEEVIYES